MKKKGFTLIELLAVIVILSVITLITIPMVTNVIEESKKKALVSSVQGILDSTDYFTMSHETGVYEFLFDKEHQGSTIKGEKLEYKGNIDGEGKLYLDKEGNTSICISNDKYYVYKNYNSGIIVGERKAGNCIIGFDALTNKYVAMLDNGTGNVSNVYSKDEINNLIDNLANTYATKEELNNNMNNLSSMITANQSSINNLSDKLNIRYRKDTDYIQIYNGSDWIDYKKAGLSRTYLYINGDTKDSLTGGYTASGWNIGSVAATDPTFASDNVVLDTNGGPYVKSLATANMIDLTNISSIHFNIYTTKGSNGVFYGYSTSKTINDLSSFKKTGSTTNGYQEYILDVSALKGSYYILAFVYGDSGSGYVSEIWYE